MTEETVRETLERVWDELERYYDELNGASDRAAAILAAAYFEGKLGDAIMCRFAQISSAFLEQIELGYRVFKDYDPIRDFSAKIEIGFALGLYNNEICTRKNLQKAREIRNKFAHASKPIEFDNAQIATICRQLEPNVLPDPDTLRSRYITYLKEVERHIQNPATNPRAPKRLTATAGDAEVYLKWTLPSETLTKVQVRWKKAADMPFGAANSWTNLSATATNHMVTDLESAAHGTEYTFVVRAENATGPGDPAIRSATPQAALSP